MSKKKNRDLIGEALDVIRRNPGIEQVRLREALGIRKGDVERLLGVLWKSKKIELVGDLEFKNAPRVEVYLRGALIVPKPPLFQNTKPSVAPIKSWIDPSYTGTWKKKKTGIEAMNRHQLTDRWARINAERKANV